MRYFIHLILFLIILIIIAIKSPSGFKSIFTQFADNVV